MKTEMKMKDGRVLTIRNAEVADAAAMVDYVNMVSGESDNLSFGQGEFGISVEDEMKYVAGLNDGNFNFMLLGTVDGKIVTMASISRPHRPRVKHIGDFGISVAKEYWGLGIGRQMCLATINRARRVGVSKIDLKVRVDNLNAIALYESVGFRHEGITTRALKIGDQYFSNLMMGIEL